MSSLRLPLALVGFAACNFPRPADVGDDHPPIDASTSTDSNISVDASSIDAAIDAPEQPGTVLHVSPSGDDGNDGFTNPVKTLKHAMGLAGANQAIRSIVLASGHYSSASGEAFPYTISRDLTIVGPAGGGAVLVGTNVEPGIIVDGGKLRDLEFEQFDVAMTGMGLGEITSVRVRSSNVALRGEGSTKLQVTDLDITGTTGSCASGVELNADSELTATGISARVLGISVNIKDRSKATVENANIAGDSTCSQSFLGVFTVATSNTFTLKDSLIDGGVNGIHFNGHGDPTNATVTNTTIRNTKSAAVLGGKVIFQMTGGELLSDQNAFGVGDGTWSITNVAIKQQRGFAFELGDGTLFTMRGCTHADNAGGIYLIGNISLDLGTSANPGNNTFQNGDMRTGLEVGVSCGSGINAVGNTWRRNVQGADGNGHYSSQRIVGPTTELGGNFTLPMQCTLQL